jgi:urease accessory protein
MVAELAPEAAVGASAAAGSVQGLLGLLRLASPALPVGAFSYSRGLEGAVAARWVYDESSASEFILGVLERCVCPLDGAILARVHAAWTRGLTFEARQFALRLRAARESAELQLEDEQMGFALRRVLVQLGTVPPELLSELPTGYTAMFAVTAVHWGIDARDALAGYFFAYCEGQVSAMQRLLPVGQSGAQRILQRALPVIERSVERALRLPDDAIGNFAPGLALASARHETQYSRLFRS